MSTRSGKRIHGSFHENNSKTHDEITFKSERKTRSKRIKENCEENIITKSKKRNNYVSYPLNEDGDKSTVSDNNIIEHIRTAQRITLKEQDLNVSLLSNEPNTDDGKFVRQTRRTKKITKNAEETENCMAAEGVKKKKKSKKNKNNQEDTEELTLNEKVSKKNKKRKGKKGFPNGSLNKSNASTDSFHSAAGSPLVEKAKENSEKQHEDPPKSPRRVSKRNKPDSISESDNLSDTYEKKSKKIKLSVLATDIAPAIIRISSQYHDKEDTTINKSTQEILNTTFEKDSPKMLRTGKKNILVKSETPQKKLNSTYEKDSSKTLNVIDKNNSVRKSVRSSLVTEKPLNTETLNTTFDKSKESILNSTFDKETKMNTSFEKTYSQPKLNTTFDKADTIPDSKKTSSISSEGSANLTYDKSNDNSRICISDDSSSENIANTTPLLIESSMEESIVNNSSLKDKDDDQVTEKKLEQIDTPPNNGSQTSATPLKREGTFTKEGSDLMSSMANETSLKLCTLLPSPGCTPLQPSRNSQKDRSMLNITCSIEKVESRRSSVGLNNKTTKVMFCSPINNPAVVAQQKRKVIKSNLKGSNKSFIFDESLSQAVRPVGRKRSYTQNDAEDARAKRKRLANRQQEVVERLSRSRTSSATVKSSEPSTPSKKVLTPFKRSSPSKVKSDAKLSRTKLPNFAALHLKQFAKMESLDECLERKAKRAKQLLTPNGAINMLERSSPKNADQAKPPNDEGKTDTPTKTPKLSTQTLKPGFTRFGFKLNKDTNPFNFTAKTETKPKENKPNGVLTRQPTQPSLSGVTASRKEVAKQTVMREKSFTLSDRRSVTRKENRTMIKGVRTNRRFDLQMKMRNINA